MRFHKQEALSISSDAYHGLQEWRYYGLKRYWTEVMFFFSCHYLLHRAWRHVLTVHSWQWYPNTTNLRLIMMKILTLDMSAKVWPNVLPRIYPGCSGRWKMWPRAHPGRDSRQLQSMHEHGSHRFLRTWVWYRLCKHIVCWQGTN